ncbi:MAG: hypothetical protein HY785_29105 [Oscillatoriophycideae cyanobacterium NC_groundwater_1537_Pr4_S-0.65um_50_18]|nr:hypothetical protein [Oscillatoriophycideae cyanobacterium NC_groundwater_1537_Pr4_S-0.65um_50_18]
MNPSLDREKAIAIAVNLLKHKSPRLVQALKDLLTFIPNPGYTKDVLEAAVVKLIYACPESALWLFQHPEVLTPHIQAREIIAQELTQSLLSWGYTLENFGFTADYALEMSEDMKRSLLDCQREPDKAAVELISNLLLL